MNNKYAYFPKYHPNRQSYDRWVDKVGQKRYDTQNKCNGFKNVKSILKVVSKCSLIFIIKDKSTPSP